MNLKELKIADLSPEQLNNLKDIEKRLSNAHEPQKGIYLLAFTRE
jgi:hypothetical protein